MWVLFVKHSRKDKPKYVLLSENRLTANLWAMDTAAKQLSPNFSRLLRLVKELLKVRKLHVMNNM